MLPEREPVGGDSQGGLRAWGNVPFCVPGICALAYRALLWAGLAQSPPRASWHLCQLWLFCALGTFRFVEWWVILPRPMMLG